MQLDWHICTHENTWLRKVNWDPLQWTWLHPYVGQGSKTHPFHPIYYYIGSPHSSRLNRTRGGCSKGLAHISCSSHNYHQVLAENLETTCEANYHIPMAINTLLIVIMLCCTQINGYFSQILKEMHKSLWEHWKSFAFIQNWVSMALKQSLCLWKAKIRIKPCIIYNNEPLETLQRHKPLSLEVPPKS